MSPAPTSSPARAGRRPGARWPATLAVVASVAAGAAALPSLAAVVQDRTQRLSAPDGSVANGDAANPSVSSTGRLIAFDSSAANLGPADDNGAVRDVYALAADGTRLLVSRVPGGPAGDGPSTDPALSGPSRRIVFTSAATNLVDGDTNGRTDIFVREGDGPVQRVSLGFDGREADGESLGADISDDGRFVVFTSDASNLVPGDTNGVEDVFVRDLAAGSTRRVSVSGRDGQADGRSGTPSISPDGRFVIFESEATNLVGDDENDIADVFVRDLSAAHTVRVSESTRGAEQNRSVVQPFRQVSDVSRGGRFVVFESDATNLVSGDTNRDTDVFLSDRARRTTIRVSVKSSGSQGNNDSFSPAITPDGRYIVFQSFASNLAPGDADGADIFVHDRVRDATVVASVSSSGEPRGPETVRQLLQQPAISNSGQVVAFLSTADSLVAGDTNGVADLFTRVLTPPAGRLEGGTPRYVGGAGGTFTVAADDPQAGRVLCNVDNGPKRECGFPTAQIPVRGLGEGPHVLRAQVGGAGMLFDQRTVRFRFTLDTSRPGVVIDSPRNGVNGRVAAVRGRAGDQLSGVDNVEVAIIDQRVGSRRGQGCRAYDGRAFVRASCRARRWVRASGERRWRLALRQRPRGFVLIQARAVDRAGNFSPRARSGGFAR